MKSGLVIAATAASILVSTTAFAEGDVCKASYEGAQVSMKSTDGKKDLLTAREQLRTCLRSDCKDWIVADCSRWLTDVESRIPTIVFAARDTAGHEITDARVMNESGAEVAATLDGRSIEMNPGRYVYVFARPDGTRRDQTVIVREGEKVQVVTATFDAPPGATTTTTTEPPPIVVTPRNNLRTTGYVVGGVGVAGLAVGSIFGLMAMSAKSGGNCDGDLCDGGTRDKAYPYATVSTIAFVAGAALVAGGVLLVLISPNNPKKSAYNSTVTRAMSLAVAW